MSCASRPRSPPSQCSRWPSGIGANTAIFSTFRSLLLRSLPYQDPDRLVMVWEDASFASVPKNTPAPGNYSEWKAQNQVFTDMAATRGAIALLACWIPARRASRVDPIVVLREE